MDRQRENVRQRGMLYLILDMEQNWKQVLSEIPLELCSFVQLRNKEATDDQMLLWGEEIQQMLPASVRLIINDRVNVARVLGVGVHLGMEDMKPDQARKLLGHQATIGLTIHNLVDLAVQYKDQIDYVGVGPVFPTLTKKDAKTVLGTGQLKIVYENSPVPVVAIGGINLQNCHEVWDTGVEQIAVCSAIMKATNPRQAAFDLQKKIE